ncbi:YccF domain-containing protein [Streptomyces sp. NBC_01803]|uniref:YccF domain-containing protein n=1 Tax=Streptomyces sp. NBC_01803 TaxID=2975946 RepID=UPI003FA367F4
MKTLLNLLWLIFSGLWIALGYAVAGLICFVLIVTIPFRIAHPVAASTGDRFSPRYA